MPKMAEKYKRDVSLLTDAVKAHVLDCGIEVHAPGTGEQIKRKQDGTPERDEKTGKVLVKDTGKPAVRMSAFIACGIPGYRCTRPEAPRKPSFRTA